MCHSACRDVDTKVYVKDGAGVSETGGCENSPALVVSSLSWERI